MTKPSWWSNEQSLAWNRVRSGEMSSWYEDGGRQRLLPHGVAETAVGFGWVASRALPAPAGWGTSLEEKLEVEWSAAGNDLRAAWWKAADAVRHGWERGAARADRPALRPVPPRIAEDEEAERRARPP